MKEEKKKEKEPEFEGWIFERCVCKVKNGMRRKKKEKE